MKTNKKTKGKSNKDSYADNLKKKIAHRIDCYGKVNKAIISSGSDARRLYLSFRLGGDGSVYIWLDGKKWGASYDLYFFARNRGMKNHVNVYLSNLGRSNE